MSDRRPAIEAPAISPLSAPELMSAKPICAPRSGVGGVRSVRTGRLRWVEAGQFTLTIGARVAVRERGAEWLGEVVVPPDRLVERPDLTNLPVVARRATDAEWPAPPVTAGRRLLESLALPPESVS